MNSFIDDALVGVVLAVSGAYAIAALGPRNLRIRMLAAAAAWLGRAPAVLGLQGAARKLSLAASKPAGACGGCDNCAADKPASGAAAAEVKVPLASIGRARAPRRAPL